MKFYADKNHTTAYPNGAIGYRSGSMFDCLGPYAKVKNCPVIIDGREVDRLTCHATGYADTYFSIPACTRKRGKYIGGFFTNDDTGTIFNPFDRFKAAFK